jgi:hypothetical protein
MMKPKSLKEWMDGAFRLNINNIPNPKTRAAVSSGPTKQGKYRETQEYEQDTPAFLKLGKQVAFHCGEFSWRRMRNASTR